MATQTVLGGLRTHSASFAPVRTAILLLVILGSVCGQSPSAQSEEERVADLKKRVIDSLHLHAGDTGADLGCGDGFYTIPLARFVGPSGKVFAVDINDIELFKLKQHLSEEGLKNVETVKGTEDDPKLPAKRLDAALIVNAYHEMRAHESHVAAHAGRAEAGRDVCTHGRYLG